jgi:phage gpG-like protein
MKIGVSVTKDVSKQVLKELLALPLTQVYVGIPEVRARRKGEAANNAFLGYIHEFGAPEANIPARPFLIPGVHAAREQIANKMKAAAIAAVDVKPEGVNRALHGAGLVARNSAVRMITGGTFLPLKPGTLAARRRRGRTGDKPLLDTGQLRASITYVVGTRGGGGIKIVEA